LNSHFWLLKCCATANLASVTVLLSSLDTPVDTLNLNAEEQLLIAANGVCTLDVVRGEKKLKVIMDNSDRAVLVPRMTWATQTYGNIDSVLIVLASHPYDKEDYIEDFELYSKLIEEKDFE
jgi:hypothetical protein